MQSRDSMDKLFKKKISANEHHTSDIIQCINRIRDIKEHCNHIEKSLRTYGDHLKVIHIHHPFNSIIELLFR